MFEEVCHADLAAVETSWNDFERAQREFVQQSSKLGASPSAGDKRNATADLRALIESLDELPSLDENTQIWDHIEVIEMDGV